MLGILLYLCGNRLFGFNATNAAPHATIAAAATTRSTIAIATLAGSRAASVETKDFTANGARSWPMSKHESASQFLGNTGKMSI